MRIISLLSFCVLYLSSSLVGAQNIEVLAETTSCEGETGFTSFESREFYKIIEGWCQDPNDPSKKLQQLMLKAPELTGGFQVLWVTKQEARNIMLQIKEGRQARINRLNRPDVKVEIHDKRQNTSNTSNNSSSSTRSDSKANVQGPRIDILDPSIAATRSNSRILTSADMKERAIVGKVDAPSGLLSLTVNGSPIDFDKNGFFKTKVSLEKTLTSVDVLAIDKQGKKQNIKFSLQKNQVNKSSDNQGDAHSFGNYYALMIANTQYKHMDKLSTPLNDADVLTEILQDRYGFEVTRIDNASRYEMMTALNDMRSRLTEKDNLLIYYAGHGAYDKKNKRGHWLPIDAEPDSTANWISTTAITDIVNSMSAKHILLVADSCYSGAITRATTIDLDAGMSEEARQEWLRTMAKTRSRHLLSSGDIKPVLDDGGNGHSIFAGAFIDVLNQNTEITESSSLYEKIKQKVAVRAQQLRVEQKPQYAKLQESEHEFGEFLLVPKDQ